jgi:hypothetical protein
MILRLRLASIALLITLVACSTRTVVSPAETTQPTPLPTATLTAVPTATAEPAKEPTAAPTQIEPAAIASADEVFPVLPAPRLLTNLAPWLLFPCAAVQENHAPTIANADGSGCAPVTLPSANPADRVWISAAAPHGSYLALRDAIQPHDSSAAPDAAYRLQPNGLDDQIWIVKLPENRIIRTITQIDSDGWARIQQMWQNQTGQDSEGKNDIPLPLAVILDQAAYHWSPDGRFLVYTGVDQVGVDLFVYDTITDTIRRMTRGRQGAFYWEWSPDGKWIVYHEMVGCRLEKNLCQFDQGPNYYAISFRAPDIQFANSFPVERIDWIAKDRYILQDSPAPGQLSSQLLEINLTYGTVTKLFERPFYSYTYVPDTYTSRAEMYLLNLPEEPAADRLTGVYLLTPRSGDLKPFHTNKFADYTLQWERTLERFILSKDVTSGLPALKEVLLAPVQMVDAVPLGILGSSNFYLSPDGFWFTTRLKTGSWGLFTVRGKLVQELGYGLAGQAVPVTWLKKSGGFYFYASRQTCNSTNGCILRFSKERNWEPTLVGEIKAPADILQVIEP